MKTLGELSSKQMDKLHEQVIKALQPFLMRIVHNNAKNPNELDGVELLIGAGLHTNLGQWDYTIEINIKPGAPEQFLPAECKVDDVVEPESDTAH
jgi:hypothetical protein